MLTDKEQQIVSNLDSGRELSQRDIAAASGLSLGMTNLLIKRLADKGFVKIRQLNWRKVQYILTPKGMMEKTRKSLWYAYRTLNQLKNIVGSIQEILLSEHRSGLRDFYILADGEARELIQMALESMTLPDARVFWIKDISEAPKDGEAIFLGMPPKRYSEGKARLIPIIDWPGAPPLKVKNGPTFGPRRKNQNDLVPTS